MCIKYHIVSIFRDGCHLLLNKNVSSAFIFNSFTQQTKVNTPAWEVAHCKIGWQKWLHYFDEIADSILHPWLCCGCIPLKFDWYLQSNLLLVLLYSGNMIMNNEYELLLINATSLSLAEYLLNSLCYGSINCETFQTF